MKRGNSLDSCLHVLKLHRTPIFEQLQIEEALLRADQRNWCIINYGSPPAIVMGISGKAHELVDLEKLNSNPIPLIRRFSGGGTVVIDEQTVFVTFICGTSFVSISPFPEQIMRWTERFYQPLFKDHPFCLYENDYVINNKKFGGNAQSITKGRWLHHSSLLWNYCPDKMSYLHLPSKAPLYRGKRSHTEFLCRLSDYWSSFATFESGLKDQLKSQFSIKELDYDDILEVLSKPHRKTTTYIR